MCVFARPFSERLCTDVQIRERCASSHVQFRKGCTLSDVQFKKGRSSSHVQFRKGCTLSDVQFKKGRSSSHVQFRKGCTLSDVQFKKGRSSSHVQFREGCAFSDVQFRERMCIFARPFSERMCFFLRMCIFGRASSDVHLRMCISSGLPAEADVHLPMPRQRRGTEVGLSEKDVRVHLLPSGLSDGGILAVSYALENAFKKSKLRPFPVRILPSRATFLRASLPSLLLPIVFYNRLHPMSRVGRPPPPSADDGLAITSRAVVRCENGCQRIHDQTDNPTVRHLKRPTNGRNLLSIKPECSFSHSPTPLFDASSQTPTPCDFFCSDKPDQ